MLGSAWLARGGVYVLANIRGGGEFGPAWHKAAMKENHIRNFEDFSAVARDLIARKITSSRHLGIMGGSQGGLLVGGTFTLYPDLVHAVVVQVPLADMRRYSKLLAGASWMAEYGDPDKPEEWAYIQTWSPYHLLQKDAKYPTPFFWTNTRDDRVHPGHARKMVAKMEAQGHPVYYFENTEGGHGSGAVNKQTAQVTALEYSYLWMMLQMRSRALAGAFVHLRCEARLDRAHDRTPCRAASGAGRRLPGRPAARNAREGIRKGPRVAPARSGAQRCTDHLKEIV